MFKVYLQRLVFRYKNINLFQSIWHVPHARLLLKLQAYGQLLNWFKNFLTGRRQCVKINSVLSSWTHVSSGVPQGSVLGPLMFPLYINDLPSLVSSQLLMFADDIKLYCCIHSAEDCFMLQKDINIMLDWSKHWLLSFNVSKCKVLHIGSTPYTGNYTLDGIQLELLDNFCDFGMAYWFKTEFPHSHRHSS